jgi:ADP-heptose:LPS heptosyltransferase
LDHFQAAAIAIRGATGLAIRWLLGPAETMIQRETQIFCSLNQMSCCTDLAVREIAAMLQHACFFLGNDSGIAHLAAAIGIPTFVLFGPTDPAEWAPWGPNVNVIRHLESCSPCSKAEMLSCADRRCLYSIDVESVISLIIAKIANGGMETIYGH